MSTQRVGAPDVPNGIDFELTQTGQPVRRALMEGFAQIIAHQWARRLVTPGLCAYQRDQYDTTRGHPAAGDGHTWFVPIGPATRWVRVEALVMGAIASAGTAQLVCTSDTDATGVLMDAIDDAPAVFPGRVSYHIVEYLEVTPNTVEGIYIDQTDASSLVRILSLGVFPIPKPSLDVVEDVVGGDFVGFDASLFPAGENIVTENLVLAQSLLAINRLRRLHKKVLFSNRKEHNCTAAAYIDLIGGANRVQDDYDPSVTLPQTADPACSVTLDVLAVASGGGGPTGNVRLRNNAGVAITAAITGTLGIFSATASVARAASTWSYEARMTGTATNLRVLGSTAVEDAEAI